MHTHVVGWYPDKLAGFAHYYDLAYDLWLCCKMLSGRGGGLSSEGGRAVVLGMEAKLTKQIPMLLLL